MKRTFLAKIVILCGATLTALLLTLHRPEPSGLLPFGVGQAEVRAAPGTPAAKANPLYNLSQLKIVNETLQKIHDNYVDPTRIDSRDMLLSALDYVQRNVAEIMVEPSDNKDSVTVQVNDKRQKFSISDVNSPWRLHARMREIFRFIQSNMNPDSEPESVEYAAANGLLSTLDPHSVLITPEDVDDIEYSTSGKFGGIGISIGMRNKKLTVLKLLSANTPAAKAGLKAGDYITKINGEETANLTLNEAMSRLRGEPRTKLTVTVTRRAENNKVFDAPIMRDAIVVSPVEEARLLKGGVGYIKVNGFPQTTAQDTKLAMDRLRAQGAKSWILDLRNNPGGLLDQAVKLTDLFVDNGTIVSTVGFGGKQRKEERARVAGTDTKAPVAVLVNGGSASASEIVAGALKNLNRAIVIGQTSFGKGSVQLVFDVDGGSKLKLTIGQYLTPGDISIQSVGITPDIELQRVLVPKELKTRCDVVRLQGKSFYMREADYDRHLTSKNIRTGDKPAETVRYLYEAPPGAKVTCDDDLEAEGGEAGIPAEEEDPLVNDKFNEDFEIQFARDYVASIASTKRQEMIQKGKGYTAKRRTDEDTKIAAALGKIGVDWSTGAEAAQPTLTATFTTDKPNNAIQAGETVSVTGTVKNEGSTAAYRVQGHMKSDDWAFEDTEFAFGKVEPGQTKSFTTLVKVPKSFPSRADEIAFEFSEANGAKVAATPLKLTVKGLPRPTFAYTYQLIDEKGNGDGLLQRGESFRVHVTVKNLGQGKSQATEATLKVPGMLDGVLVNKGRFLFDAGIKPGESQAMDFTFNVSNTMEPDELVMELLVDDTELHESVGDKLKFKVHPAAAGPQAASGTVKVHAKDAVIRDGAADDAAVIATAKKGSLFTVTGREGKWTRVELESGRAGFVPSSAVSNSKGSPSKDAFATVWQVTPPTIAMSSPSLEATGDRWHIVGSAKDDRHVEDVFVIVSNRDAKIESRKVLYRSNRGGKLDKQLDFAGDIPVWPGNNMVTVVARENNEVKSMQTMFVFRASGRTEQAKAGVAGEAAGARVGETR